MAHDKAHTKTGKSLSFFRFFVCRGCSFFGPELAVINSKRPASFSLFLPEFFFWGRVATARRGVALTAEYFPIRKAFNLFALFAHFRRDLFVCLLLSLENEEK